MSPRFEIRIASRLDETEAAAFAHLEVIRDGPDTLLRGELDQAGLHGVLERIRVLGLELIDARRVGGPARAGRDSA